MLYKVHPTAGRRHRGASAAQKLARTQAAKADLHLHFFIAVSLLRPATRRTKAVFRCQKFWQDDTVAVSLLFGN